MYGHEGGNGVFRRREAVAAMAAEMDMAGILGEEAEGHERLREG
jgi:hypothetical protein